jgi:hypothetical protein
LSRTHDFAAVKMIAVFLGIHLGVDDDAEGNTGVFQETETRVNKYVCF